MAVKRFPTSVLGSEPEALKLTICHRLTGEKLIELDVNNLGKPLLIYANI